MNAPAAAAAVLPPTLAMPTLAEGELYAGLCRGDGIWHHLILLPAAEPKPLGWKKAMVWAKKQGGDLPSRREQAVLYGNLPDEFEKDWYWSNQQHASVASYAWLQFFDDGIQFYFPQSYEFRARAVRRIVI